MTPRYALRTVAPLLALFVVAAGCAVPGAGPATTVAPTPTPLAGETADVLYFWGEGCHSCHAVTPFVQDLAREHPAVRFEAVETYLNQTNATRFYAVNAALNVTARGLPEVVADGRAFFGENEIRSGLPAVVATIEARRR